MGLVKQRKTTQDTNHSLSSTCCKNNTKGAKRRHEGLTTAVTSQAEAKRFDLASPSPRFVGQWNSNHSERACESAITDREISVRIEISALYAFARRQAKPTTKTYKRTITINLRYVRWNHETTREPSCLAGNVQVQFWVFIACRLGR